MLFRNISLVACVCLVLGCGPTVVSNGPADTGVVRHSASSPAAVEFLSLIPYIIEAVPEGVTANRPLLIDLRSFVLAGSSVSGQDLDASVVQDAINRDFSDISSSAAIVKNGESSYTTHMGGAHVRLDGISSGTGRYSALITYTYPLNAAVGRTEVYVTFLRQGGRWRIVGSSVLRTT